MSTPPASACLTAGRRARPATSRSTLTATRSTGAVPERRPRAGANALARASTMPGSDAKPDSTMTVSPSAGRVATTPPSARAMLGRLAGDARRRAGPPARRRRRPRRRRRRRAPRRPRAPTARAHPRSAATARRPAPGRRPRAPWPRRARPSVAGPAVVDARTGDERRHLAAERRRLGEHAEAVGRELAVVVVRIDEEASLDQPLLVQERDDLLGRVTAGILDRYALRLRGRGRDRAHHAACAARPPTRAASSRGRRPRASRAASSWRP